jgi:predicted HTH domain antitoxin
MAGKLSLPNLEFGYRVVNLNEVNCEALLTGEDPGDWILAVLCRIDNEEQTLKELLRKLLNLPAEKRQNAVSMLLHLARLRPKRLNFLKREVEKMSITIDLGKDPLYLQAKKEVAINLYKTTRWSIEKIAQIVKVSPQRVEQWLREEGLLKEEQNR